MKPALVTGATGFVGWHVARLLLETRPYGARAGARPASRVRELGGRSRSGRPARSGFAASAPWPAVRLVFHVAADYRLWAQDPEELYRSNVDGTRNLLEAARAAGVERVVYTSTVGCIGMPPGGIGDETQPVGLEDMTGDYKRSKFLAEQVALEFARGRISGGDRESHGAGRRSRL